MAQKQRLSSYVLTCQDDTDILINAVSSAIRLGDVWLFDTGYGARYQRRLENQVPVYGFYRQCKAKGWPVYYSDAVQWNADSVHYGKARNRIGEHLQNSYHWLLMLDSDEMLSNEFVSDLPMLLNALDASSSPVVTIAPEWLTLWPDASHYAANYSHVLAHGRVYRPEAITWQNHIHEHQHYEGTRMIWKRKILHFRQLFSERSQRQNGHGGDAWPGINDDIHPISDLTDTTWPEFVWSAAEPGHQA